MLKDAEALLVVASSAVFTDKRRFPRIFHKNLRALLLDTASDVTPGPMGSTGSSAYGGKPKKVIAGVLPDVGSGSRYNASCRPEAMFKVVSDASLGSLKKAAIIVVIEDPAHIVGQLNALGRALPLLSMKTEEKFNARIQILLIDTKGATIEPDPIAKETMDAARWAARQVDTPPTDLNPTAFAESIRGLLDGIEHVTIEEIVGDELLEARLTGIHSVGRCAMNAPRMLVAKYDPPDATGKSIALVGKGVTFDTGGLHLKPRGSIETMKCDMGGAAAVSGAFCVLAKSGIKRRITLVACLAENAIGAAAYKPDDVITMHSKKTVEINNTDAEGRLLLADGVSYAARVLKSKIIVDAATLTGAQMVALGSNHAAVMSNDAGLEATLVAAGQATGDLAHAMPFAPEFYKPEFKSPIADMRNSVKNRMNAQSSCAAQFVYNHIENTKAVWGHIDLAGPSFRGDRGTGYGVALLSEAVRNLD